MGWRRIDLALKVDFSEAFEYGSSGSCLLLTEADELERLLMIGLSPMAKGM